MKVKNESEVSQSCPTLHDPMDCSLPGSSVHGIFQATLLEWSAITFSICISEVIIVNNAERDVFLELACLFDDLAGVGNSISGSSAFSKTSLNI